MEWRVYFRRNVAARWFVPDWFIALIFRKNCSDSIYRDPETDDRAKRIGAVNENCVCECTSVGRFGSPGLVKSNEKLYSIIVRPVDIDDKDALMITMITHAQKKGMSVLRSAASDDEFRKIIDSRIPDRSKRSLFGISTFSCAEVRGIRASEKTEQRNKGDRLYSVLDADMQDLPHHADIFATLPIPHDVRTPKAAWSQEREILLELLSTRLETADVFRGGALN